MARSARSAATELAYRRFAAPSAPRGAVSHQGAGEEFDESDIWGLFSPAVAPDPTPAQPPPRARPLPAAAAGRPSRKPPPAGRAAHGSLPVKIPDWSKILGDEYRGHPAAGGGEWELDDADDEDVDINPAELPPHELAWRRRAASLSVHGWGGGAGRTLKVRDAVWKRTTGFQD